MADTKIEPPICMAMVKVADLATALGVKHIHKLEGCWEHKIDENWFIAVNGHKEKTETNSGVMVNPFECYVEYNGFPAGMFSSFEGIIAAGELANEDTFIKAIDKVIAGLNGRK